MSIFCYIFIYYFGVHFLVIITVSKSYKLENMQSAIIDATDTGNNVAPHPSLRFAILFPLSPELAMMVTVRESASN